MRSAIILATIVLIAGGGIGAHYAISPDISDDTFPARFLSAAHRDPDTIARHIAGIMPSCLPENAHMYVTDPAVLNLGAKTFMKSMTLMAENRSPERTSSELISFIIKEAEGLSAQQQQSFIALTKDESGFHDRDTMLCVMSAIKTSIDQRIDVTAEWDLRGSSGTH
ncbi:hypothetical protein [Pararhizobium sp.]|uniref:hypothetical protein n=1 Tax=Pararhizobium sp. TaxID=1977563 RepID=UPI003D0C9D2D